MEPIGSQREILIWAKNGGDGEDGGGDRGGGVHEEEAAVLLEKELFRPPILLLEGAIRDSSASLPHARRRPHR